MTKEQIKELRDKSLEKFQQYLKVENALYMEGDGPVDIEAYLKLQRAKNEWVKANSEWEDAWLMHLAEKRK